jgi:hypothetical protein
LLIHSGLAVGVVVGAVLIMLANRVMAVPSEFGGTYVPDKSRVFGCVEIPAGGKPPSQPAIVGCLRSPHVHI